jgi:hypothetical protein
MKLLTLRQTLQARTFDLFEHYRKVANQQGKDYLLFLPDSGKIKSNVVLIAHVDTVFDEIKAWDSETHSFIRKLNTSEKEIFFDAKQGVFWSPDGLGADDRAGVYAVMQIFFSMRGQPDQPVVLLTNGEESGGTGAREAAHSLSILRQCNFLLEIDRRGKDEVVYYNDDTLSFRAFIESFGFTESIGSFSDISIIAPALNLCSANISAGYFSEHDEIEHLYVSYLHQTIEKAKRILHENMINSRQFILPKLSKKQKKKHRKKYWSNLVSLDAYRYEDDYENNGRGKYREFESYTIRCRNCDGLVDIAQWWGADCPYCNTPLTL